MPETEILSEDEDGPQSQEKQNFEVKDLNGKEVDLPSEGENGAE